MKTAFLIAYRFLKSNKGQTIFIALGIGVGISVQIFIGSLITGLQESLIEKTIGSSSQITINNKNFTFDNYEEIINNIKDKRITNIVPVYTNSTLLTTKDISSSLIIKGFDIGLADNIYNIINSIKEGSVPIEDQDIILGIDLKKEYNLSLNDNITVVDKNKNLITFKISGFYDLGVSSVNKTFGFTTLVSSQKIFGPGLVTGIEMQVENNFIFKTDEIAKNIKLNLDSEFEITNWKEDNASLLSGLNGQSISSLMIQIFVIISVVLGISSVLAIAVMQKSKQIGILKAMGLKDSMSLYVFLFEGLILGICGGLVGLILGYVLCISFTLFALNPDGTPVIALSVDYLFMLLSFLLAVISSVAASIIPARKSARLNPIEIIRNN